jgi:hypothetical protein
VRHDKDPDDATTLEEYLSLHTRPSGLRAKEATVTLTLTNAPERSRSRSRTPPPVEQRSLSLSGKAAFLLNGDRPSIRRLEALVLAHGGAIHRGVALNPKQCREKSVLCIASTVDIRARNLQRGGLDVLSAAWLERAADTGDWEPNREDYLLISDATAERLNAIADPFGDRYDTPLTAERFRTLLQRVPRDNQPPDLLGLRCADL